MKRYQSVVVLCVLVLALAAGALIGTIQPEPARYLEPSQTLEQIEPQVPIGEWRE